MEKFLKPWWNCISSFLLLSSLFLISCGNPSGSPLPSKAVISPNRYSHLFVLAHTHSDTYLLLKDPADTQRYIGKFAWGKSPAPAGFTLLSSRKTAVAMSSVFVGFLEHLQLLQVLIGVDQTKYLASQKAIQLAKQEKIVSVAAGAGPNLEKIAKLNPSMVFAYYIDAKGKDELKPLSEQGIPVLYLQNFLEEHPLGRAEWIRIFGWLLGKAEQADAQFKEIVDHYESLSSEVASLKFRPSVLCNAPFQGVWDIPGGNSFMSTLIGDAGGEYLWNDRKQSGRIPMSLEQVMAKASEADIWINPGPHKTYNDLEKAEPRLKSIKAFKEKQAYNSTKTLNNEGANAFWESGVARPDIVLADLIAIFHPELLPSHAMVYFEELK